MGDVHASKDRIASWDDIKESQKIILGTLKILNRIFKTGMNEGESMGRVWEAKELQSSSIPVNSYTPKDHKPVGPNGLPKTRPLCGAHRSMNGELSEWLADIMEAMIQAQGDTKEAISTEDVLSQVDKVARELLDLDMKQEDLFVGSLDAEALYPSLDVDACSKIVNNMPLFLL